MPEDKPQKPNSDNKKENSKKEQVEKKEEQKIESYEELKERMLRLAAEFDNYKKRIRNDIENSRDIGKAELMRNLLPILDEFELALMALNKTDDKNLAKGIEILYSNFLDALKKSGLNEIPVGGTFDPYKHEIVMVKESKEKEGTIIEVIKKGYVCGDTLLRPASVIIAKTQNREQNQQTNKDTKN